jgi:predicted nucleic acid-binding Zn ribbon protein
MINENSEKRQKEAKRGKKIRPKQLTVKETSAGHTFVTEKKEKRKKSGSALLFFILILILIYKVEMYHCFA